VDPAFSYIGGKHGKHHHDTQTPIQSKRESYSVGIYRQQRALHGRSGAFPVCQKPVECVWCEVRAAILTCENSLNGSLSGDSHKTLCHVFMTLRAASQELEILRSRYLGTSNAEL
jgi:hypothetical protein